MSGNTLTKLKTFDSYLINRFGIVVTVIILAYIVYIQVTRGLCFLYIKRVPNIMYYNVIR